MKYYKTDSRKISFREYWHITPRGFWLAWYNKILGAQMNFIRGIPEPQPFKTRIVEAANVPGHLLDKLNPGARDLQPLGFDQFWYYTTKQSLTSGLVHAVQGLHSSRQILAKVIYVSYKNRQRVMIAFLSELSDGIILATTDKKREFNPLPNYLIQRKIGADSRYLFNLHQGKLAELTRTHSPTVFAGLEEVARFEDKTIQQTYADKICRGIWVEMTEQEIEALKVTKSTAFIIPPT